MKRLLVLVLLLVVVVSGQVFAYSQPGIDFDNIDQGYALDSSAY